ncbi:MAG: FkbM family methyltransferase, partial [Proteobacteria bacterium]|nr:FkbM family methyltransferase [Pseudomonadota bacterium]
RINKWDDRCLGFVCGTIHGIVQAYDKLNRSGDITFVDVGANVGKASDVIASQLAVKEFYMFEPVPCLYNYLQNKYKHSKKHHIFNCALTDTDAPLTHFDHSTIDSYLCTDYTHDYINLGTSKIVHTNTQVYVPNNRLSTFFQQHAHLYNENIIIKIDTENQDAHILNDFLTVLTSFKHAPLIEFEINHTYHGLPNCFVQHILDCYFNTQLYHPFQIETSMQHGKGDELLIPTC